MTTFDISFDATLAREGGFSDHPADRGGPTRFGVTEVVARANGYRGPMRDLSLDEAKRIAKAQYWDLLRLDNVAVIDAEVARELFDTGYNMGIGTAGRFLQRALNTLNRQQRDYPDLVVDGVVGPMTVARLRDFYRARPNGGVVLLRALNALQGARYVEIAEKDPGQETFTYGWFANRVA